MPTDDKQPPVVVEVAPKKSGFKQGHPRFGGRKAGLPTKKQMAADICAKVGLSPIEWMAMAIKTGFAPTPDGKTGTDKISLSDRCRMSETLASFCHARISATQITGKDDAPLSMNVSTLDVTKLMENPDLAQAAQRLALGLTGYPPKQLESGEDR